MNPIDIILSLIPGLNDKEKEQVRIALGAVMLTHCEKNGHKFKVMGHRPKTMFRKAATKLFCRKCGTVIMEYH